MPLTDTAAKNAKPKDKPYRIADGGGMYLEVMPTGAKYWRWKYRFATKEKRLALGVYPDVSLAAARIKREEQRLILKSGIDPAQSRREAKLAGKVRDNNTFKAVGEDWFNHWKGNRTPNHARDVWQRLEADVFPAIGGKPIADIAAPTLIAIVKGIEARGAGDIAKRNLGVCGQIFRYAVAHGICERNPVVDIKPSDILKPRKKTNYARLSAAELPELLRRIEAYDGALTTRIAMQLMALTFVRTTELIAARWSEFDLEVAEWRIPAERMKMRTPHIVPLAKQAVSLLRELHKLTGTGDLLFPGERNHAKPMSNNTILYALYRMGYHSRMTGHGFRGIASTILHEQGQRHDIIELQLAHQERNAVSAAYNHALYLRERRKMMQEWANYLEALPTGKNVIPGKFSKAKAV